MPDVISINNLIENYKKEPKKSLDFLNANPQSFSEKDLQLYLEKTKCYSNSRKRKNSKKRRKANLFWSSTNLVRHLISNQLLTDEHILAYFGQGDEGYYFYSGEILTLFYEFYPSELKEIITTEDVLLNRNHLRKTFLASSKCRKIIQEYPNQFIRGIKSSKLFLEQEVQVQLGTITKNTTPQLEHFYREILHLESINSFYRNKAVELYDKQLGELSWEDFFILITSFHEFIKRNPHVEGDRRFLNSLSMTLYASTLPKLIKRKLNLDILPEAKSEHGIWRGKVKNWVPPRNTFEGVEFGVFIPEHKFNPPYELLYIIEFYFDWLGYFDYQIQMYASGMLMIDFSGEMPLYHTNPLFSEYKRNDSKNSHLEYYVLNKSELCREIPLDIKNLVDKAGKKDSSYHQLMFLPKQYKKIGDLHINYVLWILSFLSHQTMYAHRSLIEGCSISLPKTKKWLKEFREGFIHRYKVDTFSQKIVRITGWEKSRVEAIIDFITMDLDEKDTRKINTFFCHRPLIKREGYYYWCSSLLRDRHWGNILYDRISKERLQQHPKEQAAKMEQEIAKWFEAVDYKVLAEKDRNYKLDNGQEGEFDGAFYCPKENVLFVVELKTTYFLENLVKSMDYTYKKFEKEALKQVKRGITEIREHHSKYEQLLGINQDTKIYGLILSNIFDDDSKKFDENILKMSIWELMAVLTNTKHFFYKGTPFGGLPHNMGNYNSSLNPEIEKPTQEKAWAGESFSYKDLINSNIWDELDNLQDFSKYNENGASLIKRWRILP